MHPINNYIYNLFGSVLLLLVSINTVWSQDFKTIDTLCANCDRELSLRLESTSFFQNNEYINDFTKGFTGIGFYAKPTLEYYFTNSTKVNGGVYLLKYSGVDNLTQTIPIFTVQQRLTKNIDLVFGSLYSTLNHGIEEPLFRYDRYYQDNVEYGLQFLYNSESITSDLWINWDKFIFTGDPIQEEFEIGSVSDFKVWSTDKLQLNIPFQALIYHKGGQIDTSPNPAIYLLNEMTGLKLNYQLSETQSIGIEPLFFWYQGTGLPDVGPNAELFDRGNAIYLKATYDTKHFSSMVGYWNSNSFIAPFGEYLFSSISDFDETFSDESRQLITGKLSIEKSISESIKLVLRTNAYYDYSNSDFAYNYGLYFLINEAFFMGKIKTKEEMLAKRNRN